MNNSLHPPDLDLDSFLDGELDAAARSELQAHLAACPACQQRLEARGAWFQAISQTPAVPAPDLRSGVLAAIRARQATPDRAPARHLSAALRWTTVLQALLAAVLLGISLPNLPRSALLSLTRWLDSLPPSVLLPAPVLPALDTTWTQILDLLRSPLPAVPMALEILAAALLAWLLINGLLLSPRRNR